MTLRFETLWPLTLLLVLPLLWWIGARSRRQLARRHRSLLIVLRACAVVALVLAAARPAWQQRSEALSVVYALDVSRSVSPAFVTGALEWIERFQAQASPAHSRIVAFANRPSMLSSSDEVRALEVADASGRSAGIAQDATDIERALDASLLALEGERLKRIILLSDGNQTTGDIWRVLPRLQQAGVRVYPIPATPRHDSDTWLEAIEFPDELRARQPAAVTVRVFSPRAGSAVVKLLRGSRTIASRSIELQPGMNGVPFRIRLPRPGMVELVAEVAAPGDPVAENNRVLRSAWVGEAPRVLYAEGIADSASYLAKALEGEGFEVQVRAASQLPFDAAQLARYDLVILSDVPAQALRSEQMQAVAGYVRDLGGGLLFAGGENVFGEEGYSRSAIENILPVEFQSQDKRRDLALVIAIDRSYSMKGRKMEYAKEAARAALDLLEEQHRFAVVAFDSQPYISVPMQQVRSKRRAEDQISRIQASGQTNIYPALGVVYRMLQQVESKARHVILLSDGDTHPADFERLLARMKGAGMVVSTVTIGEGGDPQLMENIAKWGGGRTYLAASAESIPQIFVEETRKAVRENMVEENVRPVVSRRLAALSGIDFERAPPLRGHVATRARETAEVSLATEKGAPLFVRWQYGLGKSAVFASDVKNRWAADWLQWEGYGKFWAQLARDVMRRESREAFDLRVQPERDAISVTLSVLDASGRFRNGLTPRVRIAGAGAEKLVFLEQSGPGLYAASVGSETGKALQVSLASGGGITAASAARAGVHVVNLGFAAELRSLPPDMELLEAVASLTGGKLLPSVEDIAASHGDVIDVARPLWPWLTAIALLLYLTDIFVRRAPLAWRRLGS
jgi:uncharacterized membrane protein